MPKIKGVREDILSEEEVLSMIDRCVELEEKSLISLLFLSGARISEILSLKKKDFWTDGNHLMIRIPSLKRKEVIPYKHTLFLPLNRDPYISHIIYQVKSIEFSSQKVWSYSRNRAWRLIKRLDKESWLHLFRHTRATLLAEKGATEAQLCAWFGWVDGRPAKNYVQRSEKIAKTLADLI